MVQKPNNIELEKVYEEIVELWRKELESKDLVKIPQDTILKIKHLIDASDEEYEEEELQKEISHATKKILREILSDLFVYRLNKLIKIILAREEMEEKIEALLPLERVIEKQLESIFDSFLDRVLNGDFGLISIDQILNIETNFDEYFESDLELVLSKINMDGLVDIRGNIFKKIEAGDILTIHKENAEILKKHGLIETISYKNW